MDVGQMRDDITGALICRGDIYMQWPKPFGLRSRGMQHGDTASFRLDHPAPNQPHTRGKIVQAHHRVWAT